MSHHPIDLHDNTFLCSLDMSRATQEQQTAWLTAIIDNELDRGDEGDSTLIWECTEQLEELCGRSVMSRKEAEKHLQALLATSQYASPKRNDRDSLMHRLGKTALHIITAAVILLMISAPFTHIYARAIETQSKRIYDEAMDFTNSGTDQNGPVTSDTLPQKPYEATYTSLKDFFAYHSHLNFCYPQQLPKERGIESIHIKYQSENSWVIVFTFLDPTVKYYTAQALPYTAEAPVPKDGDSVFVTSAREYVTTPREEGEATVYETVGLHDNIRYTMATYDYSSTRYFLSQTSVITRRYNTMEELLTEWDHLQDISWGEQLPEGFSIRRCSIRYYTQTNWNITLILDCGVTPPPGQDHTITIWPVTDDEDRAFPQKNLYFSNDKTDIYITFPAWRDSTYHKAECIVDNTGYKIVIYDRDRLLRFVDAYFGPFTSP